MIEEIPVIFEGVRVAVYYQGSTQRNFYEQQYLYIAHVINRASLKIDSTTNPKRAVQKSGFYEENQDGPSLVLHAYASQVILNKLTVLPEPLGTL